MASVLLVIGALMSGAGLYAVYHGYSIIQVEEGWASVISGATLFAGGILTVALGLVLRVLGQVKAGLVEAPARVQPEIGNIAAGPPLADVPAATASEPAPSGMAMPDTPMAPPLGVAEPESSASNPVSSAGPVHMPPPPPHAPALPRIDARSTIDNAARPPIDFHEPPPAPAVEPPAAVDEPRPADDYKLETPSTAEHDLVAAEPHATPHSPPMADDWLDRAFAELDRDNPPAPSVKPAPEARTFNPHPPERAEPAAMPLEPAMATPAGHGDTLEQSAPVQVPDAEADPPPPQTSPSATSAVIGRYESEGTTYVMFADGSIEAQSASGIYRFESMAELKSYIES